MATKVYFFLGPKYFRYDRVDDKVDDGYPLPIAGNWQGMAEAGFAGNVSCGFEIAHDGVSSLRRDT